MATKLVGADDATASGYGGNNYVMMARFQAEATGTMTEFRIKIDGACNVKTAIYDDSGGSPNNLLGSVTQALSGTGWQTVSGYSVNITSGSYYWLAANVDSNHLGYLLSGGTRKYKAATYSSWSWPNPWSDGYSDDALKMLFAGWGETAAAKTSSDTGSGADAYVSLETPEAKSSSDAGSGVEGTPLPSASLAGSETGAGVEVLVARLLVAFDTGSDIEVAQLVGLPKDLFAAELGEGLDLLTAKIEMPTKGGGMKLWT